MSCAPFLAPTHPPRKNGDHWGQNCSDELRRVTKQAKATSDRKHQSTADGQHGRHRCALNYQCEHCLVWQRVLSLYTVPMNWWSIRQAPSLLARGGCWSGTRAKTLVGYEDACCCFPRKTAAASVLGSAGWFRQQGESLGRLLQVDLPTAPTPSPLYETRFLRRQMW
jgi:hypothetical protein